MSQNDGRTKNVKKNILYSFILKGLSVGLTFVLLPLTVDYLDSTEYGIWVTLFSVMNWVNMLDMGIGLGLRNKLAEAVAREDKKSIRIYISTGLAAMVTIGVIFLIVMIVGMKYFSFQAIYNTYSISESELYYATLCTGIFVVITFVLSVVNQFYYAWQQAAKTGAINIVHNVIMLITVYYLTLQPHHSLVYFVYCFGIASISSRALFLVDFFRRHNDILPSIRNIRMSYVKNIVGIGIKFFIIQIAVVCMYSSANILITQRLGPEHVLAYDVVFKIFSAITMVHGLILAPMWNAYTEAYIKKDFIWMKNSIHKLLLLMIPIGIACAILVKSTNFIIDIWIKKTISIPEYLPLFAGIYIFLSCLNNVIAIFLNGISKIDLQMYLSVFSSIIVIPLAWYLMPYWDSTGMIMAIIISMSIETIPLGMQVRNVLYHRIE